jgi:cytochrome subunit of sulfide dehydrogenase
MTAHTLAILTASLISFMIAGASALAQERNAARDLASTCFTCHGTDGNSAGGIPPSLAGRASGELVQMMKDFQSGKRPATVMHQQARGYTDAQLKLIASYFESVKPTPPRSPAKP